MTGGVKRKSLTQEHDVTMQVQNLPFHSTDDQAAGSGFRKR